MAVKKAVKKVVKKVVRKVAAKAGTIQKIARPKKVAGPKEVIGVPVQEVFKTVPDAPSVVQVQPNSVLLFVNGRDKGTVDTTNQKLGEFVTAQAQRNGIRSFSVYVDGMKADTSDAIKSLTGVGKIEIVAKDARGM